jgi:molybdenum cofactor biosynthesis enzyme MoaA
MSKSTVCPAIEHALCVTAYGAVNPCCATSTDFTHLNDIENVTDYFKTDPVFQSKIDTEKNTTQWLPECRGCLVKETNGLISRKDKMLKWFPYINKEWSEANPKQIVHMDISFGNTCNQKCIMCNSNFSSQWLKDDIAMKEEAPWIRNWENLMLKNWSISYDQLDQIAELVSVVTEKIEIKGGEPLYDKRFWYFTDKVLEKNKNIHWSTNTNGTQFSLKNIEKLNNFRKFNIDVSLDGTGKVFEWIRNWDWKDAEQNFKNALQHLTHTPNLNYTTMMYNVDHFETYYYWAADLANKYGRNIPIHFTQIVTTPKLMSPEFASKDRIKSGIDQIDKIIEDPEGFATSRIYQERLNLVKEHLIKCYDKTIPEEKNKKVIKTHEHMVKIRGWDIRDYVDL